MITPENGKIIRALRIRNGIDRAELEEGLGVNTAQFYQIENKSYRLCPEQVAYLVDRLNMSFEDFNDCFFGGKLSPTSFQK